jgi:repressor LexA
MHLTRRQREILAFLERHIAKKGYAPTIEEIGAHFGLTSFATVHKHLTNLQAKGVIKRAVNRSRALELVPVGMPAGALEIPLLGRVAAGAPIEAVQTAETITIPLDFAGRQNTYALRVRGESMIDEQIRDGDYVIVENRIEARDGEMVIALLGGERATLKKFYRQGNRVRLQPANATMSALLVDAADVRIQGVVIGILRKY